METLVALGILIAFMVVILIKTAVIAPQRMEFAVERLGKYVRKLLLTACCLLFSGVLFTGAAWSDNNIEFLDKELIKNLNFGVYEVVTPKLESDKIEYARKLPFDKLDFVERNEKYYSIGTAFFINEQELMTAAHVFRLMYFSLLQDFYIRDTEGNVYPINTIKKYSTLRDMVVFDLKKYPATIEPLHRDGDVEIGDTVFSVGNAQGEGIAYRAGQVASFTPEREYGKWKDIRFTSPASPGNSGGPLLNLQGKVVGLIIKKNQSENYNIAVPINETDNLTNEAKFHLRNVTAGIYGVDDTVVRDWFYTVDLPATVEDIASKAQNDLNSHWKLLWTDLMEEVKEKNSPRGEQFRDYLRKQALVKGLAPVLPGKDFRKWDASGWFGEKLPITATQNVYRSRGRITDLHAVVEKPEGIALKEFLDSPKIVMDNLLKAISFTRQVGAEKIPITSLGEPERTSFVQDKLGRNWISSLWTLPYSDMFVYSSCLPFPKGVICLVDTKPNSNQKYGYFDAMHDGYNELVVGYVGEVNDWEEYFSLGEKYLPEIFHNAEIVKKDTNLKVKFKDFNIDFDNEKIKGDSSIHFHMGYSNEKLLAEDILLFEIFPVKGGKAQYRIQSFYEPGVFSSDKYKSKWDAVTNSTGDYSGKVINKGDKLVIKKVVESTKKEFTSIDDKKINKVFVTGCYQETSAEDVEKDCNAFFQSIDFM